MTDLLPWHREPWNRLVERERAGRLPHALLLSGPAGLGKGAFALRFAQALLCDRPQEGGGPCGGCKGCRLFLAGTHPDFHQALPEGAARQIKVDTIRGLSADLALKSQLGGYKLALLDPAEAMNVNAANSLLKTLEEPSGRSLLLLVSARPARLPATIRSRCQVVEFHKPAAGEALAWLRGQGAAQPELLLALADGAPLHALAMAEAGVLEARGRMLEQWERVVRGKADPLSVAQAWVKEDWVRGLRWLCSWVMDMIRLGAAEAPPGVINRDAAPRLAELARGIEAAELHRRYGQVLEALRLAETPANPQLLLEELLLAWAPRG